MEWNNITELQNKILEGLKISAQKLIEEKQQKQQKMAISVDGKIKIIIPQK
jgi:hypothetical protein